ncbi:hypothetical protein [Janibacter sp. G1551]|uniref:hypothetical protein n=1 Tax=Janibacter sp. G1551 TaxID=3420440 RepID=UPI003CFD95FE
MSDPIDMGAWLHALLDNARQDSDALHSAYQQLENAGVLNNLVVHRYLCRKGGCKLATVIRVDGVVIARTKDYKLAPGANLARSVEAARIKNTLDGERHWPGHTFPVSDLAGWGDAASIDMNCRHRLRSIKANAIMATVADVQPGHPGKPTLL